MTAFLPRVRRGARTVYERDRSYVVTSAVIVAMAVYFTSKQRWGIGFDIWEHAAAVRELMHHPFSPNHAVLPVDAPHQLFTPYHLGVALFGRIASVDVTTALAVAGIANLILVLVALRLFVNRLAPRPGVTTLTLLFTLFLWGNEPWAFSGFLDSRALWLVLAYPATFATAAALFALVLFMRYQDTDEPLLLPLVSVLGAVVIMTHQIEALLLYGVAATFVVSRPGRVSPRRQFLLLGAAAAGSALVALAWPYFSLWDLTFSPRNEAFRSAISRENAAMYTDVWGRIWLAMLGVPFLVHRLVRNARDPVALALVVSVAVYVYGWRTDQYLLGRSIAFVVLMLHVTLADAIVEADASARRIGRAAVALRRWLVVTVAALLLFGANLVRQPTAQAVPFAMALPDWIALDDNTLLPLRAFRFLPEFVDRDSIVLAEPTTSFIVPAMSDAKVVGIPRPLAFVDTSAAADVPRFFDPAATPAERRAILQRDRATHLLVYIPVAGMTAQLLDELLALGTVVHRDAVYALVDLRGATG